MLPAAAAQTELPLLRSASAKSEFRCFISALLLTASWPIKSPLDIINVRGDLEWQELAQHQAKRRPRSVAPRIIWAKNGPGFNSIKETFSIKHFNAWESWLVILSIWSFFFLVLKGHDSLMLRLSIPRYQTIPDTFRIIIYWCWPSHGAPGGRQAGYRKVCGHRNIYSLQ